MFCLHCGSEMAAELKYCKRCGGPNPLGLAQAQESRPVVVSTGLAWAAGGSTALVAIIGIGITIAALNDLAHSGLPAWALVWIALFCAMTIFGTVGLLVRFWTHLLGAARPPAASAPPALKAANTNELSAHHQGALPDADYTSVTEHTTRTLENVKSRQ